MRLSSLNLKTQIALLVLVALVLAQAISLRLFADERAMAVEAALASEAAGRAANVARLLEAAPRRLHEDIVRAANSPLVQFDLAPEPAVTHTGHDVLGGVEARIRALLEDDYSRDIRVEVHDIEQGLLPLPNLSPEMAEMHAEMMRGTLATVQMDVSIAIAGGSWLNVGTRFERPPLQWSGVGLATFGLSAVLLIAGFWVLLARLTGPINRLALAADRLGRGEQAERLQEAGPQEARRLTASFNRMQARLTRFVRDRTQMLAALAHDLRSPITAARVEAEMVDDAETRAGLVAALKEMEDMVEATLAYARGVGREEAAVETDFGAFLYEAQAQMKGGFEITPGPEVRLSVKPQALRRALRNLVLNAVAYGGAARVGWSCLGEDLVITVEDEGPGIPENMWDEVFKPYRRLEESRSLETGGHGLGLSIARSIVLAHGGTIAFANRSEGGLRVTVALPLHGVPVDGPDPDRVALQPLSPSAPVERQFAGPTRIATHTRPSGGHDA